jgi:hypothetical protein
MKNKETLADKIALTNMHPKSKVDLWLAYKKIKPVSWIDTNFSLVGNNKETTDFFVLLKMANLYYRIQPDDSSQVFVSSNPKLLDEIIPIYNSDSREAILTKCKLFGYPIETGEAQSAYYNTVLGEERKVIGTGFHARFDRKKFPHRWLAYLNYTVRKGHEYEDSLVAKKWYDTIRKDLPEVHKQILKIVKTLE